MRVPAAESSKVSRMRHYEWMLRRNVTAPDGAGAVLGLRSRSDSATRYLCREICRFKEDVMVHEVGRKLGFDECADLTVCGMPRLDTSSAIGT